MRHQLRTTHASKLIPIKKSSKCWDQHIHKTPPPSLVAIHRYIIAKFKADRVPYPNHVNILIAIFAARTFALRATAGSLIKIFSRFEETTIVTWYVNQVPPRSKPQETYECPSLKGPVEPHTKLTGDSLLSRHDLYQSLSTWSFATQFVDPRMMRLISSLWSDCCFSETERPVPELRY